MKDEAKADIYDFLCAKKLSFKEQVDILEAFIDFIHAEREAYLDVSKEQNKQLVTERISRRNRSKIKEATANEINGIKKEIKNV
jgi:hypothetical protein